MGTQTAERDEGAGTLLLDHRVVAVVVLATPAVLLRNGRADDAEFAQCGEQVAGDESGAPPVLVRRNHLAGEEVTDQQTEVLMGLFEQGPAHRISFGSTYSVYLISLARHSSVQQNAP